MNPAPRPLATVTRIGTPAEQAMVTVPAARYVAQCAALQAAATLVREIRTRAAAQNHRVPHREYKALAARLEALAPLLEES
jgi:hypothetical protein